MSLSMTECLVVESDGDVDSGRFDEVDGDVNDGGFDAIDGALFCGRW